MLILSRNIGDNIIIKSIEGDVKVSILGIERGKIKVGIEAPTAINIVRGELLLDRKAESTQLA